MIIVIEGCNGVGKTTYANAIAKVSNGRIIRAFRPDGSHHFTGDTHIERRLREFNVPYNTYIDDLYVATILEQLQDNLKAPVILDRSMPSAIAYDLLAERPGVFQWWLNAMQRMGAHYLWLHCDYDSAPGSRKGDAEMYAELHATFAELYERVIGVRKASFDVARIGLDFGIEWALRWLNLKT